MRAVLGQPKNSKICPELRTIPKGSLKGSIRVLYKGIQEYSLTHIRDPTMIWGFPLIQEYSLNHIRDPTMI